MPGLRPGDVVRVLQDRAWVVASFDQSDAAWEDDMQAYLGQTGVVLEVDESSTEVRHDDSSEFWWANAALARAEGVKEDHPTLLSSRARDGATVSTQEPANAAGVQSPVPSVGQHSVNSLLDGAAAAATGLFGSVSAAAGSVVSGAKAVVPVAPEIPTALLSSVTSPPQVLSSKQNRRDANTAARADASRSSTPDLTAAPLLDATPSPAQAHARSSVPASAKVAGDAHDPAPARRSINITSTSKVSHQPIMTTPEITSAHMMTASRHPSHSNASTKGILSSASTGGVHTPASPQQRRFFFPPQIQQNMNDHAHANSNAGQRGYVGINVTKQAPFIVLNAADVMDQHGVLQGHEGYSNMDVQPGDHLVRVDGHGVEFGGLKSLQNLLGGELGSVVELVFARNNAQFSIRAVRHGPPTGNPCSVGALHVAGSSTTPVAHFVGQPVALDAQGKTEDLDGAEMRVKGHVQSEVERLKEKMDRMEQEAVAREERAKEREREKERQRVIERDRQLSARLRELEGVVMTSVSHRQSTKRESAESEGSAPLQSQTGPDLEDGKLDCDQSVNISESGDKCTPEESRDGADSDVPRGTDQAAAVLAAARAEAAVILKQAEDERARAEASAASILKKAEESRATALSSVLQPSLVAAAEARAEAILKQAQEQRIAAEKAAEDARAASIAAASATAELNRERQRKEEEEAEARGADPAPHSGQPRTEGRRPLRVESGEDERLVGQREEQENVRDEAGREDAAAAAVQRLWKRKKSMQTVIGREVKLDAGSEKVMTEEASLLRDSDEGMKEVARASGVAEDVTKEEGGRDNSSQEADAARAIWRFWLQRTDRPTETSRCSSVRLHKPEAAQHVTPNRAQRLQSRAEATIHLAAGALAEAVAAAEQEGTDSGTKQKMTEEEKARHGAGSVVAATNGEAMTSGSSVMSVTLDMVLDWAFADLAGKEDEFKALLIEDVVFAVGGDRDCVHVLSLDAGSVIAKLQLQKGVCGDETLVTVARELEKQARENGSRLRYGKVTHKVQEIKNVQTERRAKTSETAGMDTAIESPGQVMLSLQDWEAEYASTLEFRNLHRIMQDVFSEVDVEKSGKISLQQWRSYLHRSILTPQRASQGQHPASLEDDSIKLEVESVSGPDIGALHQHGVAEGLSMTNGRDDGQDDVNALLREADAIFNSGQKAGNSKGQVSGASGGRRGRDGVDASRSKNQGLHIDVESLDRDLAYSWMQYRQRCKSTRSQYSAAGASTRSAFLQDTDSPREREDRSWRNFCSRVCCCCCLGWDRFWRRRSCCAFFMHFLSTICLIIGLLLVGWEIGCNQLPGISSYSWEAVWRESTPYCQPAYRIGVGCCGAGLLTVSWLLAFYAPPPGGWGGSGLPYDELVRRLHEFEASERLEDQYVRRTYAQMREEKMAGQGEQGGAEGGTSKHGGVVV